MRMRNYDNNHDTSMSDLKATSQSQQQRSHYQEDPPQLLITTLRKERDSLQQALTAELHHRRQLEHELEQLRSRLQTSDTQLRELRDNRDRLDDEYRSASQRHVSEYSS